MENYCNFNNDILYILNIIHLSLKLKLYDYEKDNLIV